nr:MAG TPA: hypothetical protein [Caudoviricetes sp.]
MSQRCGLLRHSVKNLFPYSHLAYNPERNKT